MIQVLIKHDDPGMKRFSVRLTRWHYKRLIWWARAKGQSISGMAERTIAARIEANEAQIDRMIEDEAKELGISTDEVKEKWLREANYDPSVFADDKPEAIEEG